MTDEQLREIEERANAATPGPWESHDWIDGYGEPCNPTHWLPLPQPPHALNPERE